MKAITSKEIIANARGAELFAGFLTGQQSLTEWAQGIARESITTKAGREISAARAALNGAQFAMTNIALSLRAATELGKLPFTKAVSEIARVYTTLDALRSAFAGVRNEAHREMVVAELTLNVKDGAFDALQSEHGPYTREELEELAREGSLPWDEIDDILAVQDARQSMGQAYLMDSDGAMVEDEGKVIAAVHEPKQLWDMELRNIQYAEHATASVALIGMDWPTHNPMWEALLDRLADVWQASIEYADDKEAAARKIERREQVVDNLHANPVMARWVINHIARRVFRDIEVLKLRAEDAHARLEWVERRAMNEERYGVPASVTRPTMGEQPDLERKAHLLYLELSEAELDDGFAATQYVGVDGIRTRAATYTYATEQGKSGDDTWGKTIQVPDEDYGSALSRDRRWYGAIIEGCDGLIAKLQPLYQELRAMDLQLAKLWELFDDGIRPVEPPVYWNAQRAFLAGEEDAARDAIRVEMAMAKQKAREAEGDAMVKAAALVEAMLGL